MAFFLPATVRLGPLRGTRVGLGTLTVDRQATTVAKALVRTDFDLATNVGLNLTAEVTLNLEVCLNVVTKLDEFLFRRVLHASVRADAGGGEGLCRAGAADSVDVCERDLEPLLAGEVDAGNTCHGDVAPVVHRRSSSLSPGEQPGLGLRTEGHPRVGA